MDLCEVSYYNQMTTSLIPIFRLELMLSWVHFLVCTIVINNLLVKLRSPDYRLQDFHGPFGY